MVESSSLEEKSYQEAFEWFHMWVIQDVSCTDTKIKVPEKPEAESILILVVIQVGRRNTPTAERILPAGSDILTLGKHELQQY